MPAIVSILPVFFISGFLRSAGAGMFGIAAMSIDRRMNMFRSGMTVIISFLTGSLIIAIDPIWVVTSIRDLPSFRYISTGCAPRGEVNVIVTLPSNIACACNGALASAIAPMATNATPTVDATATMRPILGSDAHGCPRRNDWPGAPPRRRAGQGPPDHPAPDPMAKIRPAGATRWRRAGPA